VQLKALVAVAEAERLPKAHAEQKNANAEFATEIKKR